ncbi:hypothetical protein QUF76_14185, partial [Desulfobacterales bacterium HSG16]|nr:hypothetical protein [Desulfobacterales bacterium HSG16]
MAEKVIVEKTRYFRELIILVLFLIISASIAWHINFDDGFATDQITYIEIAKRILDNNFNYHPFYTFSYVIAFFYEYTDSFELSLKWILFFCCVIYLKSMYFSLSCFHKSPSIRFITTIISIVPHYTLGMTYWGFAGAKYVLARILFTAICPIVLALFFQYRNNNKVWIPFLLCAAGCFLHLSAVYLFAVLVVTKCISDFKEKHDLAEKNKKMFIAGMLWGGILIIIVRYFENWQFCLFGNEISTPRREIYSYLLAVNINFFSEITHANYVDLLWDSMYKGYWWTMFPPRISDIAFFLFTSIFVIFFAIHGAVLQWKNKYDLFKFNMIFIAAIVIVAFGYQCVRFIGWKLLGTPPNIFEEVRTFKYLFWPLFTFIATYLTVMKARKRYFYMILSIFIMMIPNLETIQNLPEKAKEEILSFAMQLSKKEEKIEYVVKALN